MKLREDKLIGQIKQLRGESEFLKSSESRMINYYGEKTFTYKQLFLKLVFEYLISHLEYN